MLILHGEEKIETTPMRGYCHIFIRMSHFDHVLKKWVLFSFLRICQIKNFPWAPVGALRGHPKDPYRECNALPDFQQTNQPKTNGLREAIPFYE